MLLTFIDIETSGFNTLHDVIYEAGYLRVNVVPKRNSTAVDMNIVSSGSLFFYKEGWNSEAKQDAFKAHGLSHAYMKQFADPEIFDRNISALYTLLYNSYICGKNSDRFDIPMMINFIERNTVHLKPIIFAGDTVDVEKVLTGPYREYYEKKYGQPTKKRGNLEDYMEMAGISKEEVNSIYATLNVPEGRMQYHSGLYDALMTYLSFKYAVEKLHMTFAL